MKARRVSPSRALVAILAGVVVALAVMPASAAQAAPEATCSPKACDTWQVGPVTVTWTDSAPGADPASCNTVVSAETSLESLPLGTPVRCDDGPGRSVTTHVKIDKTPPVATGAAAGRPADSGIWFNHPVTYTFSGTDALSGITSCTQVTYSGPDTASATVDGTCSDKAGNTSTAVPAAVHYDATPPSVAGIATRPPDFNGWYNHPVAFAFSGVDATSGIASCQSVTYSGPTDGTASVSGSCTDNAGNRGTATESLRYDSTPPAPANLTIKPRSHALLLSWPSIADANTFVVTRSEQGSSAAPATVYSGIGHSVLDQGLQNGKKYRYTITDTDQAGNSSSQTVPAVPTGNSLRPVVGARVTSAPLLTWKKVKGAGYYNIQLYRGGRKILTTWPGTNSFQVKRSWRFNKKKYSLTPGHYRWYVWPGIGKRSRHLYGHILGQSSFRLVAP